MPPKLTIATVEEVRVQQAIARGWTVTRIMTDLGISYEEYAKVRDDLEDLVRGGKVCDDCETTFVNLARHVTESHMKPRARARCGSYAGYAAHRRYGEAACDPCRRARAHGEAYRRAKRKRASDA